MEFNFITSPVPVPGLKTKRRYEIKISTSSTIFFGVKLKGKQYYRRSPDLVVQALPELERFKELDGISASGRRVPYWYENSLHFLINGEMEVFRSYMPTITDNEMNDMWALAKYGLHSSVWGKGTDHEFRVADDENTREVYRRSIDKLGVPERAQALIKELEHECIKLMVKYAKEIRIERLED